MPEYLATVRLANGRKVTENVVAGSADDAVQILRDRGCVDVVLHNDDVMALSIRQREKARQITPGDYLLIRNWPRVGVLVVIVLGGYRKTWVGMALLAFGLVFSRSAGGPWELLDWVCLTGLLFPLLLALFVALFGRRTRAGHQKMLDALYQGRWEETLRRADRVGPKVPAHELALRKAQALAGLDRLDEALKLVEPFGEGQAIPGWHYHSMLAQIYEFARRPDRATVEHEKAVELAPGNSTLLLAQARYVLWHARDARRARELLTRARSHALSDLTAPFADMVEGLILLEEGRPHDALTILEATHRVFHARRHMPLGYLPVEHALLGLALAHAATGEGARALELYTRVRPRLVVLRSMILDRCDRAIGRPLDA